MVELVILESYCMVDEVFVVIIVGVGFVGMFVVLEFIELGFKFIILEWGKDV